MIWFTSDTHFGHNNIIKYCNRPFNTVHEMNKTLTQNWNDCVKPNDEIYFLGDFAFSKKENAQNILDKLNGIKYLILGNHDQIGIKLNGWMWIKTDLDLTFKDNIFRLSHYSNEKWSPYSKYHFYLHGHSHGKRKPTKHQIDVGVDCWNYKPVSIDTLILT